MNDAAALYDEVAIDEGLVHIDHPYNDELFHDPRVDTFKWAHFARKHAAVRGLATVESMFVPSTLKMPPPGPHF